MAHPACTCIHTAVYTIHSALYAQACWQPKTARQQFHAASLQPGTVLNIFQKLVPTTSNVCPSLEDRSPAASQWLTGHNTGEWVYSTSWTHTSPHQLWTQYLPSLCLLIVSIACWLCHRHKIALLAKSYVPLYYVYGHAHIIFD